MKLFRPKNRQTQQIFTALILTSILSLGAGTTVVNSAAANSISSPQGVAGLKQRNREIPRSVVNAIRREIARTYRIPPGQLKVVSATPQTWSDSCLGLGGPAESCAQILIQNGWRVVVSNGAQTWAARTDGTGRLVRLESQKQPRNNTQLPNSVTNAVLRTAAGQLGVPRSQLQIIEAEPQTWSDRCLGLGSPVELCERALTPGWRVVVGGQQQRLVYHTDDTGSILRLNQSAGGVGDVSLPQSVVNIVLQTAAQDTGLRPSDLRIVQSQQIQGSSSCLGMSSRSGEACTRDLATLWQVTVEAGQQRLVYHTTMNGSRIRLNEQASNMGNGNVPRSVADAVLQFAAQDWGLSSSQLRITQAQPQTWPDSCLGLPRPTERCMGTLTPGWQVSVEGRQRTQVYRTDDSGSRIRSEAMLGQLPVEGNLPNAVAQAVLADASRQPNVYRGLRIVQAEQQNWPDGCLGLAERGVFCTQAIVPGWRVLVEDEGQTFVYRTNASGSVVKLENGAAQGNTGAVPMPDSEYPAPLGRGVVFRAIEGGGFTGRTTETLLTSDGQVIRRLMDSRMNAPAEMYQISRQEVQQFQQLLERRNFAQFDRLVYPAPKGAADFITVTLTSQMGTTSYADMGQDRLPESLQAVLQAWRQIANRR
ncbi:MAG TPA: hypothetical protein V6D26_25400 [Stenomitos sp.]